MKIKMLALATASLLATVSIAADAAPKFGTWGYDATAMDSSVKPGDDFFDYVNGSWFKRTEIAADRTFAGIDSVLNDQIERDVRAIVEDMAKDPAANGRLGQQIGDLYASWMDEDRVEQLGTEPLKPYLARIAAVKTRGELVDLFAEPGFDSPVGLFIIPDFKNPTRYALYASQGGLGMPNRDYYLLKGEKYDAYRKAYRDYVIQTQKLAGIADAEAKADRIIALETQIAKIHWTPEQSRDVDKIYNLMTRAQLRTFAPQLQWDRALEARSRHGERRARRGSRTDLRPAPLPGRERSADARADRQHPCRVEGQNPEQQLDGRADQGEGAREAGDLRPAHRAPAEVHRLFVAGGEARRLAGQCDPLKRLRLETHAVAVPQAGGPDAVGHAAADQQRLLRPDPEPDHFPRRDPAAALFRPQRRSGVQLRQHRRDDRARDRPWLRRPGAQVRRPRQACGLVERQHGQALHRACRQARRAVQQLRADPRRAHQGSVDARREPRRPRRPRSRLCRVPQICRRPRRAAGHRRADRRPALLHRLRLQLGNQAARRCAPRAAAHERAQPCQVPGERRRAEHGRLVQSVQRPAGRQDVPRPRGPGARLVGG